jgi:hypothetical protein
LRFAGGPISEDDRIEQISACHTPPGVQPPLRVVQIIELILHKQTFTATASHRLLLVPKLPSISKQLTFHLLGNEGGYEMTLKFKDYEQGRRSQLSS